MGTIGYAVMCEQFHPSDLVEYSKAAEDSGFTALMVSDHFQQARRKYLNPHGFVWIEFGVRKALIVRADLEEGPPFADTEG